ncbi:MAG TPA: branched-chain amino acid ABC transporter permease, partial [Pseudonocardiaceae bacterium]|nr:branched-chain amino acid ABC transporter permease [Pseudonocardiaceae bacterium]
MAQFLNLVVTGLVFGAVYTLLALGVVLIYRVSRVVNLAHGAIGVFSTYVFHFVLMERFGLPVGVAFCLALAVGAVTGALTERLWISPVRREGPLVMLITTVAALLVLTEVTYQVWGTNQPVIASIFSERTIAFAGTGVTIHQLGTAGITLILALALSFALNRTRYGKAVEAIAEDPGAARIVGLPVRLITTATWGLGGMTAALAGMLFIKLNSLDPISLTLVLIGSLVAAVFGGFTSFGLAAAGAMTIGVVFSLAQGYVEITGSANALVFILLLGV